MFSAMAGYPFRSDRASIDAILYPKGALPEHYSVFRFPESPDTNQGSHQILLAYYSMAYP